MFAEHSWYFRNSLVRANYENLSKGIHKTEKYLVRFLSNLLFGKNQSMKNREMHVQYIDTIKTEVDTVNDTVNDTVFNLIKQNTMITSSEISQQLKISLSTAKRKIKELKQRGKIERIGSDKTGRWKIT
jgi:predicted HTH transcriptional regulator